MIVTLQKAGHQRREGEEEGPRQHGDIQVQRNIKRQGGDHERKKDHCSTQRTVEDLCKGPMCHKAHRG